MPEKLIPITIRIPEAIKKKIDELSYSERRSVNNQIIYLLEEGMYLLGYYGDNSKSSLKDKQPES